MDCRHVRFSSCKSDLDLHKLQSLFELSAFWAADRSLEDWAVAIENSNPTISVWDGDRLIGFARATSDGIFRATIWDVVVHPEYRGIGLGSKMVETLLSHPLINRVERVYLMTTHKQRFYGRIGFQENPTTTMVRYDRPLVSSLAASSEARSSDEALAASIEAD